MTIYREIKVKSILNKTTLPGADFTINPYIGCEHACAYCYARFIYKILAYPPMTVAVYIRLIYLPILALFLLYAS